MLENLEVFEHGAYEKIVLSMTHFHCRLVHVISVLMIIGYCMKS